MDDSDQPTDRHHPGHKDKDRHSIAVPAPARPVLTEIQKANQEALNALLQTDRMIELIRSFLNRGERFRLRPSVIQELNRISLQHLEHDAGRWRDVNVIIGDSTHVPPPADRVAGYVDGLCEYVNDHWNDRSALHLAAYIMWRLNWIHPFVDGNGRTTRAVSYYVLCCHLGFYVPAVTTIPDMIASNKPPYYKALESADEALKQGRLDDVSDMENLLHNLLAKQMVEALEYAKRPVARAQPEIVPAPRVNVTKTSQQIADERTTYPSTNGPNYLLSVTFAAIGLVFFMILVLFGVEIPTDSRWLVVIVFSLVAGLSFGFVGGTSNVRGSIPVSKDINGRKFRFSVTGGIGAMVLILLLSWWFFL